MKRLATIVGCICFGGLIAGMPGTRSDSAEPDAAVKRNAPIAPPQLTAPQAEKIAGRLQRSLEREPSASVGTLTSLWQLRGAAAGNSDAVLLGAILHSDPRVVMLAADALAQHRAADAQPVLAQLRDRDEFGKHYGFRRSVTDAVTAWQNAAGVDFLIERLPEAKGQYELVVVSQLMRLTGQNFADDREKWAAWWTAARPDYRGPPASAKDFTLDRAALAYAWSRELPEFFDVPLFAKRIVFVIDRSKSMLSSLRGETRLEVAQDELVEAIRAMEEDVEFNIVAYDDVLVPWRGELVRADGAAKADAVQFVASIFAGNKTASYDAVSQSLVFSSDIELVVLLSDGKPTAGRIVDPTAIVAEITKENAFLRATIDTLGIDTEDVSETFMYDLSRNNYGTYTKIR